MPDDITLKEFMDLRFSAIEEKLAQLSEAIKELSMNTVEVPRFERLANDVANLNKSVEMLTDRLLSAENTLKIGSYVGGAIIAVIVSLAIAWARYILGI